MARILVGEEWFDELASTSLYESEFESILLQEARKVFSEYYVVPFKTIVLSEEGDAKPDLALIHRQYRRWWVVEVEMSHHSLTGHVLPQVRRLARANYGDAEVAYLWEQSPDLRRSSLVEMFKGSPPRILVVANAPVPGWIERLRAFDALVAVFQVFRSRTNKYLYRLNGEFPSDEDVEIISTCRCWALHRFLKIDSPAQLEIKRGEVVSIHHETGTLQWERVDTADSVLLHALRDHPLEPSTIYEIVRSTDGVLSIRLGKVSRV
ncbi:MAG TPA: hypothetical protein VF179_01500 [Thermoanaerobaculia bacterium]|nr:hypothetical protein [Thermoanaerobaculia bacterium]